MFNTLFLGFTFYATRETFWRFILIVIPNHILVHWYPFITSPCPIDRQTTFSGLSEKNESITFFAPGQDVKPEVVELSITRVICQHRPDQ